MYQVTKRDGKVVEFDIAKISAVITKAFEAQDKQYHPGEMCIRDSLHTDIVHIISYRKSLCQMIFRHDCGHAMPQ